MKISDAITAHHLPINHASAESVITDAAVRTANVKNEGSGSYDQTKWLSD